jgi:hypothetical protein
MLTAGGGRTSWVQVLTHHHVLPSKYSYSPAPLAPVDVGDAHLRHHSIQRAATGEPHLWLISFVIKRDAHCTCTYHRLHTVHWKALALIYLA